MSDDTKVILGVSDIAKAVGVHKDQIQKTFEVMLELLTKSTELRVHKFGTFKRKLMKGRTITSPVLEGGSITYGDKWVLNFSAHASAKQWLNAKLPIEAPEKPKAKKSGTKKPKGKKPNKTEPAEVKSEVQPKSEPAKAAKEVSKAAKAAPKAKGGPRKASGGVKKAS